MKRITLRKKRNNRRERTKRKETRMKRKSHRKKNDKIVKIDGYQKMIINKIGTTHTFSVIKCSNKVTIFSLRTKPNNSVLYTGIRGLTK